MVLPFSLSMPVLRLVGAQRALILLRAVVTVVSLLTLTTPLALADSGKGLFWEVKGNQGSAWLLGAVHFADASFYPMRPAIDSAYQDAAALVVEVDIDAVPPEQMQALLSQYSLYPNGETLSQHLRPATLQELDAYLKKFGLPLAALERQKPGFVAMTLAALQLGQLGFDPNLGVDLHFMRRARADGKDIREIETLQQQFALIDNLGDDDAVIQEAIVSAQDTQEMMRITVKAWKEGDAATMANELLLKPQQEHPEFEPIYDRLFYQRNQGMAKAVDACIKARKKCFVVVGAGHLVGERSLVDYLQRSGYQVEQR